MPWDGVCVRKRLTLIRRGGWMGVVQWRYDNGGSIRRHQTLQSAKSTLVVASNRNKTCQLDHLHAERETCLNLSPRLQ